MTLIGLPMYNGRRCAAGTTIHVNADYATCFLYGADDNLPAPPAAFACAPADALSE